MSALTFDGSLYDSGRTVDTLRDIAKLLDGLADAIADDDSILGALVCEGLANHLPALPKHIRDVLTELLTDDAARSYRADLAYQSEPASPQAPPPSGAA